MIEADGDFENVEPAIIRKIAKALLDYFTQEINNDIDNVVYTIMTPVLERWANWKLEEAKANV